jgi:outer membrane protein assembly factor BamE (lipoprotein component of BamABCDE complex)
MKILGTPIFLELFTERRFYLLFIFILSTAKKVMVKPEATYDPKKYETPY